MKALFKIIASCFVLIAIMESGIAQTEFSKVFFEENIALRSSSVVNTFDGGYIISGTRHGRNFFCKINSIGDISWARHFGTAYSSSHTEIIALADSNFLRLSSVHELDSVYSKVSLLKIDTDGDTLWSKIIDYDTAVLPYYIQQTTDGGFITTNNIHRESPPNHILYNSVVSKLDESANLIWSIVYIEGDHSHQIKTIKQTPDNGFIASGTILTGPPDPYNIFLMKLSPDGNIVWSNKYPMTYSPSGEWHDIVVLLDGYIVTGFDGEDLVLVKTDLSGNVLWANTYNTHSFDFWLHRVRIRKLLDGNLAVISPDNLIKLDTAGSVIYAIDLMMHVSDFVEAPDKGLFILGNGPMQGVKLPPTDDDHIGIIKTDSLGQGSAECTFETTIEVEEIMLTAIPIDFTTEEIGSVRQVSIQLESPIIFVETGCVGVIGLADESALGMDIQIFPNPTTGIITIQSTNGEQPTDLEVYNFFGEKLFQFDDLQNMEVTIDLNGYTPGLYFVKFKSNNKIFSRKIMFY